MAQYGAGRFAAAESSFRKTLELGPDFAWGRLYLAKALLAQGKADAALAILQQERDDEPRLELLPIALQAVGRKTEADAALQELITRFGGSSAYFVAINYAQRGDRDLACCGARQNQPMFA
jgi:predicted Zn-dependent protease